MNTSEFVAFGELLMRLTASDGQSFEAMPALRPFIGGAEANVCVGVSRLGHKARMISVVPNNDLGRATCSELRRWGVNTDSVSSAEGRLGLYFLTPGAIHRPSDIIYDRANSCFATHDFSDVDWESLLKGAKWLHISGVTAAIGQSTCNAALAAMKAARKLGIKVAYDGNYRAKMWAVWQADAPSLIAKLMAEADMIFGGYRDFELVYGQTFSHEGFERETEAAQFAFSKLPNLQRIVSTQRTQVSADHNILNGQMFTRQGVWKTENYDLKGIVDRIGGGDAFAAGLYHGLLSNQDEQAMLNIAIAAGCLKHAQPGDFCLVTQSQINDFLSEGGFDVKR